MSDEFARFEIDMDSSTEALVGHLDLCGLAIFRGTDTAQVLARFREIATAIPHRDSRAGDLVTSLRPRDEVREIPGFAGFGNDFMSPHTDGTGQAWPPELIGLACAKPADSGGEALLVDGLAIIEELLRTEEETIRALAVPGSVRFGESTERYAVLTRLDGKNRYYLRYRADGQADFGDLTDHVARLQSSIARHTRAVRLARGDGYVLQNGRWLHGRTAFTGSREMLRLIGRPICRSRGPNLRFGFTLPAEMAASWRGGVGPTRGTAGP
jgi:hypothetical protein